MLNEQEDGEIVQQTREYATFRKDLVSLAEWLRDSGVELVAMENRDLLEASIRGFRRCHVECICC